MTLLLALAVVFLVFALLSLGDDGYTPPGEDY